MKFVLQIGPACSWIGRMGDVRSADACRVGAQILRSVENDLAGYRMDRLIFISSLIVGLEERAEEAATATD